MKALIYLTVILIFTVLIPVSVRAQTGIDVESGLVIPGYNDVRIPGDQGTLFSFHDDLKSESSLYYRIRLNYTFNSRHAISLLYAPLKSHSDGIPGQDIYFNDDIFQANTMLEGTYIFNSYRLTYRYDFLKRPGIEFGVGVTAKIRDAKILLSSAETVSEKTNTGFVPLINFKFVWNASEKFGFIVEGDALAAPQGRAEDILIAGLYRLSDRIGIRAGYRILEGGADNDEVYNFSLFNYASVGISYSFKRKVK